MLEKLLVHCSGRLLVRQTGQGPGHDHHPSIVFRSPARVPKGSRATGSQLSWPSCQFSITTAQLAQAAFSCLPPARVAQQQPSVPQQPTFLLRTRNKAVPIFYLLWAPSHFLQFFSFFIKCFFCQRNLSVVLALTYKNFGLVHRILTLPFALHSLLFCCVGTCR